MIIKIIYETDNENKLFGKIHSRIHETALKIDKEFGIGVYISGMTKNLYESGQN